MFLGGMKSRYHLANSSDTEPFLDNILQLSESNEEYQAHPDTLDYLLRHMDPGQLSQFIAHCLLSLIRRKVLDRFRFDGDFLVAIDATGCRTFSKRHCPQCLHQRRPDGSSIWFHNVLEAKLITSIGMVFSMATVMIENPHAPYDKQDCELKAFYRLVPMLRNLYPRLRICLLLDSLYAGAPTIELCEQYRLGYFIVFTKGTIPTLWQRAQRCIERHPEYAKSYLKDASTRQVFRWATNMEHQGHTVHFISCEEVKAGNAQPTRWAWLTDARPDPHNVHVLANKGGRQRWKIENQGFNVQKNGELALVHGYGGRGNALLGYYLLAQIAHMILQLIAHSDLLGKVRNRGERITSSVLGYYKTIRNLVERLRESLHRDRLDANSAACFPGSIQIRFNSS